MLAAASYERATDRTRARLAAVFFFEGSVFVGKMTEFLFAAADA